MSSETRKVLEDIFNGRMLVRRSNPKPGQSPYYYVVPQSDDEEEISIVDVPMARNENLLLPTGSLNGFAPAVSPLYKPRQDSMTSFVAKPYFMEEMIDDRQAEREKELQCLRATEEENDDWKEKEREAADAALIEHLRKEEGDMPHLYLDTVGKNTFCVGHMSASPEETARHPWYKKVSDDEEQDRTNLASRDEIFKTHRYIQTLPYGQKYGAPAFKEKSNLRLPEDYCRDLLEQDLATRRARLQRQIPNYESMSPYLQNSLLEVNFNVGNMGSNKWPKLHKAAQEKDVENFCKNLQRKITDKNGRPIANMPERNKWNLENCRKGYFYD